MQWHWWTPGVVGLAVVALGCGKQEPQKPQEAPKTATSQAAEPIKAAASAMGAPSSSALAAAAKVAPVEIKLLDPGKEPRKALRFQFRAGQKEALLMELHTVMAVAVGANKQPPIDTPPIFITMNIDPTEVRPNGDVRYSYAIVDANVPEKRGIPEEITQQIRMQLQGMQGLSGWALVDNRGQTKETEVSLPEGAPPEVAQILGNMRQTMTQVSAPLPEEPVGVGARWEVTMSVDSVPLKLQQTASYTLKQLQGDKGTLEMTLRQTAPKQVLPLPGMPGPKPQLESLNSTGSGAMRFDLNHIVYEGNTHVASDMSLRSQAPGQPGEMKMSITVDAIMKAPPAGKASPSGSGSSKPAASKPH